jgi:hypothetical protein
MGRDRLVGPASGVPMRRTSAIVPSLPLRGVLNRLPDQASPSSRQSRRGSLYDSCTENPFYLQTTPAIGFGSIDAMASLTGGGTPLADRRTPSKVTLPLLLNERSTEEAVEDGMRSAAADMELQVLSAASALVLNSVVVLLRGGRRRTVFHRRGGHLAGTLLPLQSTGHALVSPGDVERSQKSVLEVLLTSAGIKPLSNSGGVEAAVVQMFIQRGELRSQRICALVALLLAVCDAHVVRPVAVPRAPEAAACLAVCLLCTTQEHGQPNGAPMAILRRILFKGLVSLCHRSLLPLRESLCPKPQPYLMLPPPVCEFWALTATEDPRPSPLLQVPMAVARRIAVLAACADEASPRAELVSLLHLVCLLLAPDAPLSVQVATLSACHNPVESVAHTVVSTDHRSWDASLVALLDSLLLVLASFMRSLLLPPASGQRLLALVCLNTGFLETVIDYTKAVLLAGIKLQGNTASCGAVRLRTLDFFVAYVGLVHRLPAAVPSDQSGCDICAAASCKSSQDLTVQLTSVNIVAAPLAMHVTPGIGLQEGGNDIVLDPSGELAPGGGALSLFDASQLDESSMTDGLRSRRCVTRSEALRVRSGRLCTPAQQLPLDQPSMPILETHHAGSQVAGGVTEQHSDVSITSGMQQIAGVNTRAGALTADRHAEWNRDARPPPTNKSHPPHLSCCAAAHTQPAVRNLCLPRLPVCSRRGPRRPLHTVPLHPLPQALLSPPQPRWQCQQ